MVWRTECGASKTHSHLPGPVSMGRKGGYGILIARDSEFKVTVEGFRGAFSVFKVLLLIRT